MLAATLGSADKRHCVLIREDFKGLLRGCTLIADSVVATSAILILEPVIYKQYRERGNR